MFARWWAVPGIGDGHFQTLRCFVPKIRQALFESVFYLYRLGKDGKRKRGPCGTGFLVIRPSLGYPHLYGVSNWHIVCRDGASIIRLNTRDGKSRFIELDPSEWELAKNSDDLMAVDLTEKIDPNTDHAIGLFEDLFITPEWIKKFDIGIGEDTFMCGLFEPHHGGERNVPVARFGNLSMMPSDAAPIKLETGAELPCYLVDTRSRGGFSGSPVFVFRVPMSDMESIPYGLKGGAYVSPSKSYFWGLLGIHCAQFWEPMEVRKDHKPKSENDPIIVNDKLMIGGGTTIVIPAWRIKDLLDYEVFETARQKRDDDNEERALHRPRPEAIESGHPASDANPNHLEDFNRLVDVAARKRPQGDQP